MNQPLKSAPAGLPAGPFALEDAGAQHARREAGLGWALGLLGVLIFALTIPLTRLASGTESVPQLGAAFVGIGRAGVAGVLAAIYLLACRAAWPSPAQWNDIARSALGVVFGFPLCMGFAVMHVDAVHASVVTGILPLATAALAAWVLGQRAPRSFWLCALVGAALVIAFAAWKGGAALRGADVLLLAAVALGALGYVYGAKAAATMPPQQVISWALVLCLPLTLPLTWKLWPEGPVQLSAWAAFGYVALGSQWLGFFAWYAGLRLGGTVRVSQVQLLQPFLSMLFALPILGERVDAGTLVFATAVMATVLVARRIGRRATGVER